MILALETAAEIGGVALLDGEALLGERRLDRQSEQAASLLPTIDRLLVDGGWELGAVDLIALSIGPGSFTGLRVGLATALGLCGGTERCIVPVPTLAALSLHADSEVPIVPMLDARKGQVYTGVYGPEGASIEPDRVCDPLPWLEQLRGRGPVSLLGPGATLYRNEIETALGQSARILPGELGCPRAASVGLLGARLAQRGAAVSADQIELRYLRRPQAELESSGLHVSAKPIT